MPVLPTPHELYRVRELLAHPSAQVINPADQFRFLQDSDGVVKRGNVSQLIAAVGGGGGGEAGPRWNGKDILDLNQAAPDYQSANVVTASASVVPNAASPSGNDLRLSYQTNSNAVAICVWLFSATPGWDAQGDQNENRSFSCEIDAPLLPGSGEHLMGPVFLADLADLTHAFALPAASPNSRAQRIDRDVETSGIVGNSGTLGPALWRWNVKAGKQAGVPPTWICTHDQTREAGQSYWRATQASIGGAAAATWNPLAADKLGICVLCAATGSFTIDMHSVAFRLQKAG